MALLVFEQPGLSGPQVINGNFLAKQSVAIGATSTKSSAFNKSTNLITVAASAACHVEIADDPTATTASFPLAADEKADFKVKGGQKIAVIQA